MHLTQTSKTSSLFIICTQGTNKTQSTESIQISSRYWLETGWYPLEHCRGRLSLMMAISNSSIPVHAGHSDSNSTRNHNKYKWTKFSSLKTDYISVCIINNTDLYLHILAIYYLQDEPNTHTNNERNDWENRSGKKLTIWELEQLSIRQNRL
jgi:hypothetical protein